MKKKIMKKKKMKRYLRKIIKNEIKSTTINDDNYHL